MTNWYMSGQQHSELTQFECHIEVFFVCSHCNCPTVGYIWFEGWNWDDDKKGEKTSCEVNCNVCKENKLKVEVTIDERLKLEPSHHVENYNDKLTDEYFSHDTIIFFRFLWFKTLESAMADAESPGIDDMEDHQFFSH